MSDAKRRLGRGLDGLIPGSPGTKASASAASTSAARGFLAPIEQVHPNREQPRTRFDDAALAELAASIEGVGVLEPILVRTRSQGGYEIIAGERRWRAAQRAGLREVPVFVRELSTNEAFEAAVIENLQREDLNPVEVARALHRLVETQGSSHESVAKRVGKDRSTVANALRLLKLPDGVLGMLEDGTLSEGHGRALLGAADPATTKRLAKEAAAKGWSVRETERQVRASTRPASERSTPTKSANVRDLELRLTRAIGARVSVDDRKGEGTLVVKYTSYDELDRIIAHLTR
jgi:ParB family chromosome partitioning protein